MDITPQYAKIIAFILLVAMIALVRWPHRFASFYFLFRPLVQPFAYSQYRLIAWVPLTAVFPVLLIAYSFLLTLFSKTRTFFPRNSLYLYSMLFFFVFSSFFSVSYIATVAWSLKFITGIMMFVLMYNNVESERDFMSFVKVIVVCSLLPMLFGYYQFFTGTGHAWKGPFYAGSRIDSFLGEYNAYGEFLCLVICATLIWLNEEKAKMKRTLLVAVLLSLVTSLILSLNRGSWIALTLAIVLTSLRYFRHLRMRWLIIGFMAVILLFGPLMVNRFQELEVKNQWGGKNTLEGRINHWKDISVLVLERPFLGYGAGTALFVMERKAVKSAPPHNDYLLLWFECGLFTMVTYILFLFVNTMYFMTRRNKLLFINYSLTTACIYFMVISFVQNIIGNVTVFPMFLGLVGAGLKVNSLAEVPALNSDTHYTMTPGLNPGL